MTTTTKAEQIKALQTAENMVPCKRCDGTGAYGPHGKCWTCRGSKRVMAKAAGAAVRALRAQMAAGRKAIARKIRSDNDLALEMHGIRPDELRYWIRNSVAGAQAVWARYYENYAFTESDLAFLADKSGDMF